MSLFGKKEKEELARIQEQLTPDQRNLIDLTKRIEIAQTTLFSLEASLQVAQKKEADLQERIQQKNELLSEKIYEIRGIRYKLKELMHLAIDNPDWYLSDADLLKKYDYNVIVYKHSFLTGPVALVPDPTNKNDPNAIKIIVSGQHIGFIPRESTEEVRGIMAQKNALPLFCAICGGDQKCILNHRIVELNFGYAGRIIVR